MTGLFVEIINNIKNILQTLLKEFVYWLTRNNP